MTEYQEKAIAAIEAQQAELKGRSPQWMVGEQLKDICRMEPRNAELIAQDLENESMSIVAAEKKIKAFADGHKTGNFSCVSLPPKAGGEDGMKPGDKVVMNDKYHVSEQDRGKVWIVKSEPWNCCGTMVVKLEGKSGGYAVDGLDLWRRENETDPCGGSGRRTIEHPFCQARKGEK